MDSQRDSADSTAQEAVGKSLEDRWVGLLFGIRRSIRYHSRRESFFSRLHKSNAFLNVILGTATAAAVLKTVSAQWSPWFSLSRALAITCLSALDLVFGFADKARQHSELRRRFTDIERCMIGAADEKQLKTCVKDRLSIEASEPPKMFALDVLCHNELLRAEGYDRNDPDEAKEYWKVSGWQRLTANVWPWEGARFERDSSAQKKK